MQWVGNGSLILVAFAAAAGAFSGREKTRAVLIRLAQGAAGIALLTLLVALVRVDTRLVYVVGHTEHAAPLLYRVGALWSGAEGSLMLWCLIATLMAALGLGGKSGWAEAPMRVLLVLSSVLAIACLAMGSFDTVPNPPLDGFGLAPALQNPWLILHPPLVFASYCGFAWLYGCTLGKGQVDARWLQTARVVGLVSWLLLGTAIWMGMQWARQAQGWGSAWNWDAIETASLAAWLVASAALVLIRGGLEGKVAPGMIRVVTGMVFPMALVCTFAARGGSLVSAHAYGSSGRGWLLLSAALLLASFPVLAAVRHRPSHISYGPLYYSGLLLLGMALATAIGTLLPLLRLPGGLSRVAPPSYYVSVLSPLGLTLLILLTYSGGQKLRRRREWHPMVFVALAVVGTVLAIFGMLWGAGLVLAVCWVMTLWRLRALRDFA